LIGGFNTLTVSAAVVVWTVSLFVVSVNVIVAL